MARRKQPSIPDALLDQLLTGADPKRAFAKDGLFDELKKALAERALNAKIDLRHHPLESSALMTRHGAVVAASAPSSSISDATGPASCCRIARTKPLPLGW